MARRALFLDRDGTINTDYGYVYRQEDFHFIDGIFELVAAAKHLNYLVIIITNQSGIGRGYYTEDDFKVLMTWVRAQFSDRGGTIDDVYYCPDHPTHGQGIYRRETIMRKPAPGMFFKAAKAWNIDLSHSISVGDSERDMEASYLAGIKRIYCISKVVNYKNNYTYYASSLQDIIPLL
jgi:D-glycero-D-manno-heptose 1,7-bisphosphate phosphatase